MQQKHAGFTLLEVLIAISIFAISISIVYGLYTSIISVVNNVEERTGLSDRVQVAFSRLSQDLRGLHRGEQGYLLGVDSGTNTFDDEPFLEFVSSAHLSFNPEADPVPLSVIRYYLAAAEQDETFALLRSDTPLGNDPENEDVAEARKFTVCEGLTEVVVTYMDPEDSEQTEWDSREDSEEEPADDARFPVWVSIEFAFPAGNVSEDAQTIYSTAVFLRPGLIAFAEGFSG